jgi:hypothetical protein
MHDSIRDSCFEKGFDLKDCTHPHDRFFRTTDGDHHESGLCSHGGERKDQGQVFSATNDGGVVA